MLTAKRPYAQRYLTAATTMSILAVGRRRLARLEKSGQLVPTRYGYDPSDVASFLSMHGYAPPGFPRVHNVP